MESKPNILKVIKNDSHYRFNDRFIIQGKLAKGSFGEVYAGEDTQSGVENKYIVLKVNELNEMHEIECELLKTLNEKGFKNFPKLLLNGHFKNKPCVILERFGLTLEFYEMINRKSFSYKTVNQIGIKLITLIEQIHSVGYLYNDLKPDNICIGHYNDNKRLH